jgi:hypothetical protein
MNHRSMSEQLTLGNYAATQLWEEWLAQLHGSWVSQSFVSCIAVSSICAAPFSSTCSTQSDNSSRKLQSHCGCQFLCCALTHTVQPRRWRHCIPLRHWWTSTRLHDLVSQKIVLFIVTAATTNKSRTVTCFVFIFMNIDTLFQETEVNHALAVSLLGECSRVGCSRPRARNPRTSAIHDYCSLRCSRTARLGTEDDGTFLFSTFKPLLQYYCFLASQHQIIID